MTSANLVIGLLVLGLVIYRQLVPRLVKSNMRIPLVLAVIGLIQVVRYLDGHHAGPVVIAEIVGSLVLAAVFGFARAATVRLSFRQGQWWSQGTWLTALLWIASLAAHLGFDFLVGGKGQDNFGNATILVYLAVTFTVQRLVVQVRSQRAGIGATAGSAGFA